MRIRWDMGLGRELGYVFWALTLFEAAYGTWATIWPLWIEHLGAGIGTVGIILSLGGLLRPFILLGGTWLAERVDTRRLLIVARSMLISGVVFAAFARSWEYLLLTVVLYGFGELVFPTLHAHIPVHAGDDAARAFSITCTVGPSAALMVTPLFASRVIDTFGMQGGLLMSAGLSALGTVFVARMDFSADEAHRQSGDSGTLGQLVRHIASRDVVLIHALSMLSLGIGSMLLPNFLQDERGFSPATITLLSSGAALGTLTFGFIGLRVPAARRAPFLAAAWSIAVTALGYLLFATSSWLPIIAVAWVFRGGMFATWTFLLGAVGQYVPRHLQSRAFAVVEILGGGALSFSPIVAASLYGVNALLPLLVSAVLSLAMAGVIVWRYRRGFEAAATAVPVKAATQTPSP